MKEKQKKDGKNLYNFDYESKEERKLKEKKLKEKELREKELKKNKKIEEKRNKADEKKSASSKNKKSSPSEKNGQVVTRKKYDDEIIIGVTKVPEKSNIKNNRNTKDNEKKAGAKNKANSKKYDAKNKKINNKKLVTNRANTQNNHNKQDYIDNSYIIDEQNTAVKKKKSKRSIKIIKFLLLTAIIVAAVVFAMLSPIFNLKSIEITGNSEITNEQIISLSGIEFEKNIFKINNQKVEKNIKQNAYINDVTIHKRLPNTILIEIQERHPNYMLEYGNGYVYINNQGYMLEISSIKINMPILEGVSTSKENYKEGNRLDEEDLSKLGTVIKIMNLAQSNKISELITKIDIKDANNYTLYFESEEKTAYLGDCSNLETRMLYLVGILDREKNNAGEIFINMNLNTDDAYFRESV